MRKIFLLLIFLSAPDAFSQWSQISTIPTTQLNAVKFFDQYTGVAAGVGGIWRSINSGVNWTQVLSNANINAVSFPSNSTGFAVGDSGKIYSTSSNGNLWNPQYTGIFENLNGVSFFNNNYGNAVGQNGRILRTTSGGAGWFIISNPIQEDLNYVQMFDNTQYAFAVGSSNHEVLETTSTGYNWMPEFVNYGNALMSGYYLPGPIGRIIAVGVNGRIRKTTDYGANWSIISCPVNQNLNCVTFADVLTGYIAASAGMILVTSDGGLNWSVQSSPTALDLKSVSMINSSTGWIVGNSGVILREGIPLGIENNNSNSPKEFRLEQNYPNPFNPSTKIRFDVAGSKKINVKIVVYDVLGKDVKTLVNTELVPGTYETDFNAGELSTGIYVYKLIAGEFNDAKKMVLVK